MILATISGTNATTIQGMRAYGAKVNKEVTDLISNYSKDSIRKLGISNDHLSTRFYNDSYVLGFDCQASAYISNIERQFEDLRERKGPMLKVVGANTITKIGTWVFPLQ